ncbi:MAG: hypothetical protein HQK79_19950 [Desulfobacterales bacterium]|nr:hypothetical protein [Desulfobacterales bacterium]
MDNQILSEADRARVFLAPAFKDKTFMNRNPLDVWQENLRLLSSADVSEIEPSMADIARLFISVDFNIMQSRKIKDNNLNEIIIDIIFQIEKLLLNGEI